ncbi:VPLPA-CTERM sorting domain-containing protein [Amphiplicatus metriothermophilus]|uniref:VPLPA-CTERM protein sorting domain-containing protein n=1 Tax=Amphiplicatus metriothermophilus TaxID=1519374 RepID=A0A239PY75_9PROT|nr:VPLPA-CTERM sorting domain-containing protein [Amphiplicatus metriothermophilus]MBB5520017.1 hypothetical protein [Amphiplicatus metriothermophilus]SNT74916.1 VPLPA-CTERM protein sorting domain-containing protein [Amphiplicatus metriothermophilus]
MTIFKSASAVVTCAAAGLAAFLALTAAAPAQAAAVACSDGSPDVTGRVTPNAGCQFSDTFQNDAPAPTVVNTEAFFGFSDWIFDAKDNDLDGVDEGANTLGLVLTGDAQSGTWALTGISSLAGLDVMLVFKGGTIADPAPLIAYLVADIMGSYLSPFFGPSGQVQDISHVSVYYRETVIPLPAAAWLMLAGLAGLGFAGRRRKTA